MKATMLISAAIGLFMSVSVYAQKSNTTVYTNYNEPKGIKEMIMCDNVTNKPLSKATCSMDNTGKRQERVVYTWDDFKGWTCLFKHQYQYNENDLLTNVIFTKWNSKTNNWEKSSENVIYEYNFNNEFIAIIKAEVDIKPQQVLTQK